MEIRNSFLRTRNFNQDLNNRDVVWDRFFGMFMYTHNLFGNISKYHKASDMMQIFWLNFNSDIKGDVSQVRTIQSMFIIQNNLIIF